MAEETSKKSIESTIAPIAAFIAVGAGLGAFLGGGNLGLITLTVVAAITWLVCVIVAAVK